MVNIHVNDNNNQIRINVPGINNTVSTQSTNPNNNVSSTIGNETFYNGLAKEWAISSNLVQGLDYSSKYYAGKAKESADIAESAIEDIGTAKDEAIDDITDAKTDAISDMETAKQEKITDIENTASDFEDDLTLLTQRAETAATNAQNSADYVVNNAPTATVTQTSTGATITTKDLTHGTTTANILNGAKGDKGDKGDQGEQGIQGIQGIQGEQGIQGIQGEQGEKGDKGDKGDTGDDGYSPTATVSKSGNTATITITDKNGTTTANVYDGVGSITDVQVDGTSVLDGSIAKIDLTGKYDASNPDGFISGITSSDVTTALGYTPYNATNPNNYISASALTGYATETWVSNQNYVNSTTLATTLLDYVTNTSLTTTLTDYQPLLVSGTNIKTLNGNSILGSGDLTLDGLPSQTGQSGKFLTTDGTDASWGNLPIATASTVGVVKPDNASIRVDNDGTLSAICRNVGEIISSTLPLTDAGLHLLDGSLLQYGIYKEFIGYIADLYAENPSANYFTTESAWQSSVSTYGSCGKFVYNATDNTVRLPKVSDILQGTTDVTALGDLVEAGLPNIKGTWTSVTDGGQLSGATYQVSDYSGDLFDRGDSGGWGTARKLGFNASRSSSIYGKSLTVQPQTIKCFIYIVIANSAKTEIQVDIDEVATDLNGKADVDLSNMSASQSAKNEITSWGMPDYSGQISLSAGTTEQTYTAPSKGYIGYNFMMQGNNTGYVKVNDITVITDRPAGSSYYDFISGIIPVDKNDVIKYWSNNSSGYYNNFQFYPMRGAN